MHAARLALTSFLLFMPLGVSFMPLGVSAQTAKPVADPPKAESAAQPETKKAKKPRSEAQKKNDERMRACGKEWRAAKAANKTNGQNWRQFSTECRRKKKAG